MLVKEVKEVNLDFSGGGRKVEVQRLDNATSLVCRYDTIVFDGKVHAPSGW